MASTAAAPRRLTVDDLLLFPEDGKRRELVDGRVVEWDVPNFDHGFLLVALSSVLRAFVREHRLGVVVGGDLMVRILGSNFDARGADIAFYPRRTIPADTAIAVTDHVPALVVELISPSDRAGDMQEKIDDWRRTGVRLIWYLNARTGTTTVYEGERVAAVTADETLTGGDILPGFSVRLRDLLDELEEMKRSEE